MRTAPKIGSRPMGRYRHIEAVGRRRPTTGSRVTVSPFNAATISGSRANAVEPAGASPLESTTVLPARSTITTLPPVCSS